MFLGVGLGSDRPLDCPGTELPGSWQSLEFIEALKYGTTPEVGGRVVVLGGGNTAIDVARESVRLGAQHVTIAYRRTRDLMPAYGFEVDEASEEGVAFEWLAAPVETLGKRAVESILSIASASAAGLAWPAFARTDRRALHAARRHRRVRDRTGLAAELAEWGIDIDDSGKTNLAYVYAGGDVVNGGASVVQAVAEGRRAARAIEEDLCAT